MPQRIDQRQLIMIGIERIASSFVPVRLTFSTLEVLSLGIVHGRYRRIQLAFLFRNPKNFFEGFLLITVIEITWLVAALYDVAQHWSLFEKRFFFHLRRRLSYLILNCRRRSLNRRRWEHWNAFTLLDDKRIFRQKIILFMHNFNRYCWLFLRNWLDTFCWFWFL